MAKSEVCGIIVLMLDGLENFNFDMLYVMSQLFALVRTIFSLMAVQRKKKIQFINYDAAGSICAILHYLCLGAWTGAAIKAVSLTRNIIAGYEEVHKKKVSKKKTLISAIVFVSLYIVIGFLTYESIFSLLAMAGVAAFTTFLYLGNIKAIRYVAGISSLLWLIYNIHVFSIVGIASEALFIVNDVVAILRYQKKENDKKRRRKNRR